MEVCFPTSYFGNIAYFSLLVLHDQVFIEGHEHFVKQTGRTRCELSGPQGVFRLSVPVNRPFGNKTSMNHVVCSDRTWQKQHKKAMHTAYGSSPFYDHYESDIDRMLHTSDNLITMNTQITEFLLEEWGFNTKLLITDSFRNDYDLDFRNYSFTTIPNEVNYTQVLFSEDQPHQKGLSVLDLLFCEGPMGRNILIQNSELYKQNTQ